MIKLKGNCNKRNFKSRVKKARKAQIFTSVLHKTKTKIGATILVPGTDGKQYHVILRWIKLDGEMALRAECLKKIGVGHKDCSGNCVSVCYHVMAAVIRYASENNKKISICHNRNHQLENLTNGKAYQVISRQSRKSFWIMVS